MNRLSFYDSGLPIPFASASFSQSSSQWTTIFNFTLSGADEINYVNQKLVYTLGNQSYHLIVDDYDGAKSAPGKSKKIAGRALTALLDTPYSEKITKTWAGVMFSAIAAELCAAVGLGLQFQITDSFIQEYKAEKKTPIEILRELANDARVQLQTSLNGQFLIVCYKFKTTPPLLAAALADKTLSRLFPYTFQLDNLDNFDYLLVYSELASKNTATVEQKVINNYIRVRVFLPNWSSIPPTLTHYDNNTVTVEYAGIKTVEKTFDDVAIEKGIGKVDAGAVLVSYKFYCKDLGAVIIQQDGTVNTSLAENGLMRIKATVQCHEFKLTSTCCDKVRFDVFEPDSGSNKHEIRFTDGTRYADDVVVKLFSDPPTLIAAGAQVLIGFQDSVVYSLPNDHWDDLPLPGDIVAFEDKIGYCDSYSVTDGDGKIKANVVVKVPVL